MQRLLAIAATSSIPACGYGVVDPLPAPPACQGAAASIAATAVIVTGGLVQVTLSAPTLAGTVYSAEKPANVKSYSIADNTLVFTVDRVLTKSVKIVVMCGGRRGSIDVSIDAPATAKEGQSVTVTLTDGY